MCIEKKITLSSGNISVTITKDDEGEVSLSIYGGRFSLPKFKAYNLKTALYLVRGWAVITTSVNERDDFNTLTELLEDELGGELMIGELHFVRFGNLYKIVTNIEEPDTWWIINETTKEAMAFSDCCDDFMRYSFFNQQR
ncbi:hypothetical protein NRE35_004242 [Salmonella enterica]|nr:hypothetical protein [Salmonella enterica]